LERFNFSIREGARKKCSTNAIIEYSIMAFFIGSFILSKLSRTETGYSIDFRQHLQIFLQLLGAGAVHARHYGDFFGAGGANFLQTAEVFQ
jgi:hypothetical protein